jgi:hypothetical protein
VVCKRYGGSAAVMGCGLITPAEGLHTQETGVEAATGARFHQTFL